MSVATMPARKHPYRRMVLGTATIALLALTSIWLLVIDLTMDLSTTGRALLVAADTSIALVFLSDWLFRLHRADHRGRFLRRYWWELLASIPLTTETTQALRSLRLIRLVQVIIRLRLLARAAERFTEQTYFIFLTSLVSVVVVSGALGFHFFEYGTNEMIATPDDSLWWAIVTITTVGYGDIYPVTAGGRLMSVILMLFGIGMIGAYTAIVASFVIRRH